MNNKEVFVKKILLFTFFIGFSIPSFAGDEQQDSDDEEYTLKPVLLDGRNAQSTVLGLKYGAKKEWKFLEDNEVQNANNDEWGSAEDAAKALGDKSGFIRAEIDGIWTNDAETNPEAFSKVNLDVGYSIFLPGDINVENSISKDFDFGLQLAMEGDQNYDNRQIVTALQLGSYFGNPSGTYIVALLSYGKVDASENEERMALTTVDKFDRFSAEIDFRYRLDFRKARKYNPKSIGLNVRYFSESDAPDVIRDAGLDDFLRSSISLKFEKGFYIAYSEGNLPFDQEKDKVFELGFTQNLF